MKKLLIIENDTYFISQRLKEIDRDYFVLYNLESGNFEVHAYGQRGGTYAFTIPYDSLDERTLVLARRTRVENMERVINEIERENENSFKRLVKQQVDMIKERL